MVLQLRIVRTHRGRLHARVLGEACRGLNETAVRRTRLERDQFLPASHSAALLT